MTYAMNKNGACHHLPHGLGSYDTSYNQTSQAEPDNNHIIATQLPYPARWLPAEQIPSTQMIAQQSILFMCLEKK